MTEIVWHDVASTLIGSWPAKTWGEGSVAAYLRELQARGLSAAQCVDALRAVPGDFPPSVGAVAALAERQSQGTPPTFLECQREIAARLSMLPSLGSRVRRTDAFPGFIARLSQCHETVARFALALGPRGVSEMPDPVSGDSFAAGRHERDYGRVVKEWTEDPRQGLALQEARALAGGPAPAIEQARREIAGVR